MVSGEVRLKTDDLRKLVSGQRAARRAAIVQHSLLARRFVKRNRVFFSWFFNLAFAAGRGWKVEKLANNSSRMYGFSFSRTDFRRRIVRKVGPKINLRLDAFIGRLAKHGNRGRARRIVEKLIRLLGEIRGRDLDRISPVVMLNSVLLSLEPPFEVRVHKRRWGSTLYPAPMWPHRKRFLAAKILVLGAQKYQQIRRCPLVVALSYEVLAVFRKNRFSSYSCKIYQKLLRLGLKNKFKWRRFVQTM
jgi:ribosomal protein S7